MAMKIKVPGMERTQKQSIVETAHQVGPDSSATRGNVDATMTVVWRSVEAGHIGGRHDFVLSPLPYRALSRAAIGARPLLRSDS